MSTNNPGIHQLSKWISHAIWDGIGKSINIATSGFISNQVATQITDKPWYHPYRWISNTATLLGYKITTDPVTSGFKAQWDAVAPIPESFMIPIIEALLDGPFAGTVEQALRDGYLQLPIPLSWWHYLNPSNAYLGFSNFISTQWNFIYNFWFGPDDPALIRALKQLAPIAGEQAGNAISHFWATLQYLDPTKVVHLIRDFSNVTGIPYPVVFAATAGAAGISLLALKNFLGTSVTITNNNSAQGGQGGIGQGGQGGQGGNVFINVPPALLTQFMQRPQPRQQLQLPPFVPVNQGPPALPAP